MGLWGKAEVMGSLCDDKGRGPGGLAAYIVGTVESLLAGGSRMGQLRCGRVVYDLPVRTRCRIVK
jgi:hypothetical protein